MMKTTLALAFVATLALVACGKKGPLDPPPEEENASLGIALSR